MSTVERDLFFNIKRNQLTFNLLCYTEVISNNFQYDTTAGRIFT